MENEEVNTLTGRPVPERKVIEMYSEPRPGRTRYIAVDPSTKPAIIVADYSETVAIDNLTDVWACVYQCYKRKPRNKGSRRYRARKGWRRYR